MLVLLYRGVPYDVQLQRNVFLGKPVPMTLISFPFHSPLFPPLPPRSSLALLFSSLLVLSPPSFLPLPPARRRPVHLTQDDGPCISPKLCRSLQMLFLNVMWKYYGQQSFHLTEIEYLEHLQVTPRRLE